MIEYYRFIGNDGNNTATFTINKIYKIRNPDNLEDFENFIDDNGEDNGYSGTNYKYFKPATELEYFEQEGVPIPIQDYTYLIPILNNLNIKINVR